MAEITTRILVGDCIKRMRKLNDGSMHCVVTSPPYFGLRDYGMDGQIGQEETPEAFVTKLVKVFREVKRILRDDGTLWLNIGDSYNSGPSGGLKGSTISGGQANQAQSNRSSGRKKQKYAGDYKHKDLLGVPWMLAFALRADGWYLRQDIIWHKPAVMPESTTDRCTKAHEYLFLLTKKPKYFYDHIAIAEEATWSKVGNARPATSKNGGSVSKPVAGKGNTTGSFRAFTEGGLRNKRSVWSINPRGFKGAHFAVMPEELATNCLLAGTSEHGVCPKCQTSWRRVTKKVTSSKSVSQGKSKDAQEQGLRTNFSGYEDGSRGPVLKTIGWKPGCECKKADKLEPQAATVFDPFGGAGTTAMAAMRNKRHAIITELNPKYAKIAKRRLINAFPTNGLFSNYKVLVSKPRKKNK